MKIERKSRKHLFIVFEGLDGAGKTTLAKMLAADLKGVYIATPPPLLEIDGIRNVMDNEVSLETRFLYYLLGNSCVSDEIKKIRKRKVVICDRYIYSTLAIHQLLGVEINLDIASLRLEQPDTSFFIFVSDEKERRRRIRERQKRTKYDAIKENRNFRRQYMNYFLRMGKFIFIDTAHEDEESSLKRIKSEIERRTE